jgi:nucleotide-binding universal stress UspA family protein
MSTIVPPSEALKRALRWIAEQRETGTTQDVLGLVDEAARRFDLSPNQEEWLLATLSSPVAAPAEATTPIPPPLLFSHLLVATDFSPDSEAAVGHAVALARRFEARLTLLHVRPDVQASGPDGAVLTDDVGPSVADELLRLRRAELAASGITVETRIDHGDPASAISAVARSLGCDLIVLGTRGRKGIARLLLGSVAAQVLREAPCPVFIARAPAAPEVP